MLLPLSLVICQQPENSVVLLCALHYMAVQSVTSTFLAHSLEKKPTILVLREVDGPLQHMLHTYGIFLKFKQQRRGP